MKKALLIVDVQNDFCISNKDYVMSEFKRNHPKILTREDLGL